MGRKKMKRQQKPVPKNTHDLPSALDKIPAIKKPAAAKSFIGVFLDYDGTLTPIVRRPEDAVLAESMRDILRWLSERCTVAVISGRGLEDIRERVKIDNIYYAGSHGFEIAGPGGWNEEYEKAVDFLPVLDQAEGKLRDAFDGISGIQIERKRYSIAVHYRRVAAQDHDEVNRRIQTARQEHGQKLRISSGKCVYDFQPKIDWNKGKALDWVLRTAFMQPDEVFPLYIGDDITDEDAFRAIGNRGIGIVVRDEKRPTEADYALDSTDEVGRFLKLFAQDLPAKRG
jgi:trehalose-phosphatase